MMGGLHQLTGMFEACITKYSKRLSCIRKHIIQTPPGADDQKVIPETDLLNSSNDETAVLVRNTTDEIITIDAAEGKETPAVCQERELMLEKDCVSSSLSQTETVEAGMKAVDYKQEIEETVIMDIENKDDIVKSPTVTKVFSDEVTDVGSAIAGKIDREDSNTSTANQYNEDSVGIEENVTVQVQEGGMLEVETAPDSKEDQEETEMIDMENTVEYKKEDILKSPTVTELFSDEVIEIGFTEKVAKEAPNTYVANQYNVDSTVVEEEIDGQKQGSEICDRIEQNDEIIVENVVESHEERVNNLTEPDDSILNLLNPSSTSPVITSTFYPSCSRHDHHIVRCSQHNYKHTTNTASKRTPSVRTPLPPTPPPPMTNPLFNRDLVDQDQVDQVPTPPPEKMKKNGCMK